MRALFSIFLTLTMVLQPSALNAEDANPYLNGSEVSFNPGLLSKSYITMAPDIESVGPVFYENTPYTTSEYIRQVFGYLISSAHKVSSQQFYNPGSKDNYSYYTFLITALATIQHESRIIHVKKTSLSECKLRGPTFVNAMNNYLKLHNYYQATYNPVFIDCPLSSRKNISQLQVPKTRSKGLNNDAGIMQLNLRTWEELRDPYFIFDTYKNINKGLNYLFEGFSKIRNNLKTYQSFCGGKGVSEINPFSKLNDRNYNKNQPYYNLSRATWSTNYNQGSSAISRAKKNRNTHKFCRYVSKKDNRDTNYKASLDSLVLTGTSLFHQHLKKGSMERDVLEDIVYNFRSIFTKHQETEKTANLMELPGQVYQNQVEFSFPKRFHYSPDLFLKKGQIPYYTHKNESKVCGYINNTDDYIQVKKLKEGKTWTEIELIPYHSFVELKSKKQAEVISPKANVRSVPRIRGNKPVYVYKKGEKLDLISPLVLENNFYKVLVGKNELYIHKNTIRVLEDENSFNELDPNCRLTNNTDFFIKTSDLSAQKIQHIGKAQLQFNQTFTFREGPSIDYDIIYRKYNSNSGKDVFIYEVKKTTSPKYKYWYLVSNPFSSSLEKELVWIWSRKLTDIKLDQNMKGN